MLKPGDGAPDASPLPVLPATAIAPAASGSTPMEPGRITGRRRLFFSEDGSDDVAVGNPIQFAITVFGETPKPFDPFGRPAIVTNQGSLEEWTIENRTRETHEFHIHQLHFKLLRRNVVAVSQDEQQYLDTVQIPYWRGFGPYPNVTLLMDFRGEVTGDLLYHCHILQHEDKGMMAIVRVLPHVPGPVVLPLRVPDPRL